MVRAHTIRHLALLTLMLMFVWGDGVSAISLPSDGGQLNVQDFGAIPNDGLDDTAAIQAAINAMTNGSMLYLPNGTYHLSDTLFFYNTSTSNHNNHATMMGESRAGTIVRLLDSTSGFTSAGTPKPMLKTRASNTTFGQWLRDLTVHTGSGNCGAIGVDWISNNRGGLDNVDILSGGPNKCGVLGIDLRRQWPGPMTFKDVTVNGFDKALETLTDEYGIVLENMKILNQKVVGLDIHAHTVAIRAFDSDNDVPAIRVRHADANVSIVGASLKSGISSNAAIDFDAGTLYLRTITQTGYGWILDDQGTLVSGASLTEWWSQPEITGFSSATSALQLSWSAMTAIAYPDPSLWINVVDYGAVSGDSGDDAASIQAAIEDAASLGRTTVYLPFGDYRINTTLTVHGSVQRLIGLGARLRLNGALNTSNGPFFEVTTANSRVVFEHLFLDRVSGSADYTVMTHNINSWVVFLHGYSTAGLGKYVSTGGSTKMRMIDFSMNVDVTGSAQVWALGWNVEGDPTSAEIPHALIADGASFLVHLFKSEGDQIGVHAVDGAEVEVNAHIHRWRNGTPAVVAEFVNEESAMSVAATRWVDETLVREIVSGVTTDLQPGAPKQEALYIGW